MSRLDTIHFTQEQARTLTGVSPETMRHWRKVVPHLGGKLGKSARFSFTDIISLLVVHELVAKFGIHIANIGEGVDALFRRLSEVRPSTLEDTVAVVTAVDTSLILTSEFVGRGMLGPSMAVPLAPLIERMRRQMMPITPMVEQATLPFPPRVMRVRR
jgi:hypothetical protein